MPIAVNTDAHHRRAARGRRSRQILGDGLINILFVGRIVPNKRIEDHIRLAELYKRYVDSYYRFIFVGRYDGVPRYYAQIRALIAEFQMLPDRFWFTGPVPDEDLGGVLPLGGRLRLAQRARGLLRAARRGDGRRRAGAGLRRRRGAGDARRRRACCSRPKDLEFAAEMLGTARIRSGGARARARGTAPPARRTSRPRAIEARLRRRRSARHQSALKIAFIVQRYGTEILGGSEYHCRLIAERLAPRHQVEVLTTCAQDYITWKNEYPKGTDRVRGVTVRRFANAQHARHPRLQPLLRVDLHQRSTRASDEMEWLRQQGPWCPALLEYLERNHQQYDVLIFFTYLYAPTVLGVQDRAAQEHPRADGARRAGDPPRDLQGAVQRCRPASPTTPTSSAGS